MLAGDGGGVFAGVVAVLVAVVLGGVAVGVAVVAFFAENARTALAPSTLKGSR